MPKPFMRIGDGPSLLQRTALRSKRLGADSCLVVTNGEYTFKTIEEFAELGDKAPADMQLLLEPVGRNTAPPSPPPVACSRSRAAPGSR